MNLFLTIAIIISGSLYTWASYSNLYLLKYITKPITTILVIILAFFQEPDVYDLYKALIIAGLFFSLIGDIFLMLKSDKFVQGLVSFLIAHIFFIIAFSSGFGPYLEISYLIPAAIYTIIFLWILLPKTGKLMIPVTVYALVLLVFLWQATGRFYYLAGSSALLSFLGAILFVTSDSILGYTRFVKKSIASTFLIHVTYWGALLLIALSI
ncbi:MAG: lysoplasmalogenase [Bacteroidetes bacterium]|nr:lysoplasmalogenase [Bacteroidota bacterium]